MQRKEETLSLSGREGGRACSRTQRQNKEGSEWNVLSRWKEDFNSL
jgi:hypothetical protein